MREKKPDPFSFVTNGKDKVTKEINTTWIAVEGDVGTKESPHC